MNKKINTLIKKGYNFGCRYTDGYWVWFESNEGFEEAYSENSLSEAVNKAYQQIKENHPWVFS